VADGTTWVRTFDPEFTGTSFDTSPVGSGGDGDQWLHIRTGPNTVQLGLTNGCRGWCGRRWPISMPGA
jgi:hypothetical protein